MIKKAYLTVYRTIGMTLLVTMTAALIGFGALLIFFMGNSTWIAPTILTPTSDKMLQFKAGYLTSIQNLNNVQIALSTARSQVYLLTQRKSIIDSLFKDTDKTKQQEIASSKTFIHNANPILVEKQNNVDISNKLAKEIEVITKTAEANLKANLITQAEYVSIKTNIQSFTNQTTNNEFDLTLSKTRLNEESNKMKALQGGTKVISITPFLTTEIELKQQYLETESALLVAQDTITRLVAQESMAIQTMDNLKTTSYMAASIKGANLAFIPYENSHNAKVGAKIYECVLKVIVCFEVGTIKTIYTDEHVISYPIFNVKLTREVRGHMIGLDITDQKAMTNLILFIGKPLFI